MECNCSSLVTMAHNGLNTALTPYQLWYHSLERACEVSNYLSTQFPLFSVAYMEKVCDVTEAHYKYQSQPLNLIVVSKERKSSYLQLYHPQTKNFLSYNIYNLDPTLASCPIVDLSYDVGLFFNK